MGSGAGVFRTFIIVLLAFVLGAVATYIVVVGGTIVAWDLLRVHDQDGGGAMALGLVIGPVCAIAGGLLCAFVVLLRTARPRNEAPQPDAERSRDRKSLLVLAAAVVGGLVGYKVTQAIFWIVAPLSYDARWKVQVIVWTPTVVMVLGALGAGYLARSLMQAPPASTKTPTGT